MEQCINETGLVVSSQQNLLPSILTSSYKANSLKDSSCVEADPNKIKMEQCLHESDLVVFSQEISLSSTSSHEANSLKDLSCIKPDPDGMEYNLNLNKTSQDVSNSQLPTPSLLKCEVKNEMICCQFCPYSDLDFGRLKFHIFTQHPTGASIVNHGDSDRGISFFCVKETCEFSTTMCTVYEEHLVNCCPLHQALSGKEKERLKSTLQFVFDFHNKHCLSDDTRLSEYFSAFNKTYTSEDDHEQLRQQMKHNNLFSVISTSSSISDAQSSMVCEDVGSKKLGRPFSSVQNPVPVFIVENQNTNLGESQTNISENISLSVGVGEQNKTKEQLIKTDLSDINSSKSQAHTHMDTQARKKFFPCVECGKSFKYHSAFLRHMRTHTGEKPFKCNLCDKEFTYSSQFNVHKSTHTEEKLFNRNMCGSEFYNSSHLDVHKRTHTGEKRFKCNVCDKKFGRPGDLIVHNRKHTGERPFRCLVCDKVFADSRNLNKHRKLHTGERPFKCNVCEKTFADLSHCSDHKRTHTGEKPFKCNMCDKEFTRSSDLATHKRTHTGEKPFKCPVCDKNFAASRYLIRHERIHNRSKSFIQKAHNSAGEISRPLF